jgi:hypothetical protein
MIHRATIKNHLNEKFNKLALPRLRHVEAC